MSATITGMSRARRSGSRSTTSWPRSRSSAAVSRSAARVSCVSVPCVQRRERLASRRSAAAGARALDARRHHVEHQLGVRHRARQAAEADPVAAVVVVRRARHAPACAA